MQQISEIKFPVKKHCENVGRASQGHRDPQILLIFSVAPKMRASQTGRTGKKAESSRKYLAISFMVFATVGGPKDALKPGGTSHSPLTEQHSSVPGWGKEGRRLVWLSTENLPGGSPEVWGFLSPSDPFIIFHEAAWHQFRTCFQVAAKAEHVPQAMSLSADSHIQKKEEEGRNNTPSTPSSA